jgi:hypothetical protein
MVYGFHTRDLYAVWSDVMLKSNPRYAKEADALFERWHHDDEGLDFWDFFEKYASQSYKDHVREVREYRERMSKKGLIV